MYYLQIGRRAGQRKEVVVHLDPPLCVQEDRSSGVGVSWCDCADGGDGSGREHDEPESADSTGCIVFCWNASTSIFKILPQLVEFLCRVASGVLFMFGPATQTLFRLSPQPFVPLCPLPKWSVAAYFNDLRSIRSDRVILYFLVTFTTSDNTSIFSPNQQRTIDQAHQKGWRYWKVRYSLWCFSA